ncbi:hypothetical protein Pyn_12211 [Prunus yedoensis var. nudiflora]|uniref:Uncharacterized protein n=1 Tax=Prunus yedoensis var. nudiflora TaxID=2094558 RepID=A0A314ZSV9_PRUYE|nr:hypothetical protein Pyn_12211 [Prunus yedoensis var. nudiflora]
MEELEKRFGAKLRLSEKERVGIRIDESESIDPLKGSQFTLVARVVTRKAVSRENFVGVFARLEAEEDMRGRRLRTNGRRSQTDSSADNMTRGVGHERRRRWESPRHREERESWSGDRRDRGRYNNWTGYNTASWEASSKSGALADRIRRTREGEERERRIREEAWNAGMLGRRDEQPLPDESSENVLQEFVYAGPQAQGRNASDLEETVIVSAENGEAIDLNVAIMEGVGGGVESIEGLEREVSVQMKRIDKMNKCTLLA